MKPMNILIVDDHLINLKLLRAQLESEGHTVFESHDGVDALALLERQHVDVVISDILMPRMDGYQLCHEIRKHARLCDLPIIIYTSTYLSPGDEKLALDMGADKYFKKPVSVETLITALHEVIAQPHAAPQPDALREVETFKNYNERLVSKLKEKNTELQAQTEALRLPNAAMTAAANAILIANRDGTIVWVNPAFSTLTGYTLAEAVGKNSRDLVKSGQQERAVYEEMWATILAGRVWHGQIVNRRKDGSLYPEEQTITPVRDAHGEITHFIAIKQDLSERKHAEKALANSFSILQATLESTADGLLVVDQTGQMVQFNQKFVEMWGIPADILASRDDSRTIAYVLEQLKDPGSFVAKVEELYAQPEAVSFDVLEFKDGRTFERYSQSQKVGDEGVGRVWSFRDITERKRAEKEILSVARFPAENPSPVLRVTCDGRLLYANRSSQRLLEHWHCAQAGQSLPEAECGWIAETLERGDIQHQEVTCGEVIYWLELAPFPEMGYVNIYGRDITGRKRAAAELQLSQQRLSLHVEQTPLAVIEYDPTGRVRQWNPAAVAMFGYSREEAIGQDWIFIVPAALHGEVAKVWSAIVSQRGGNRSTNENITKDGRTINCEWFNTPLVDPDGRTIGVASLIQNVSERKLAETALRLAHERLRWFVDANIVGILLTNAAGVIIEANDYYLRLIGYTRDELEHGKADWRAITPPEWLPADEQAIREMRERGTCTPYEKEYLRRDGTRVPVFLTDAMLPGAEEQIAAFALDLTERKQTEAALRQSEERYRLLFDNNPLPMWVYDLETLRFLAVNEVAVQHYGYTREEFLAMTIKQIRSPEDIPALLKILKERSAESKRTGEWRHRRKDGSIIQVEIISHPLVFEGRQARLVLAADITEKKLLEEKFLHAQRLESIGLLSAGIAHDLNNVLAPIMLTAPMLRASLSTARDLKTLDMLEKSAERGAGLVKQILGFAHTSAGEFRPMQVKHLARDLISVIEQTFPKSIQLEQQISSDLWPIQGNATQIHQVLLNLCVNARDAMPSGGTLRLAAANLRLDAAGAGAIPEGVPGTWVALEVGDTGAGIPPEMLERIWEPFFTTKGAGKGTGLGLATVRGIVVSHHGFVELHTEVGRGSTFRVFLPAVESEAPRSSSASPVAILDGHGELILVVDDEAPIRNLVAGILGQHGYRVVSCGDGVEAITLFNAHPGEISLVVTDVDMPRAGGVALARALLQLRPDLRLLVMSGLSRRETDGADVPEIQKLAHAFLRKPFTIENLLGTVHRLLQPPGKT